MTAQPEEATASGNILPALFTRVDLGLKGRHICRHFVPCKSSQRTHGGSCRSEAAMGGPRGASAEFIFVVLDETNE